MRSSYGHRRTWAWSCHHCLPVRPTIWLRRRPVRVRLLQKLGCLYRRQRQGGLSIPGIQKLSYPGRSPKRVKQIPTYVSCRLTWVLSERPVRSKVVPEGTATLLRTIVAQDFFDADAADAAVKVQDPARFSKASPTFGAGVGRGAGAGLPAGTAVTSAAVPARSARHFLRLSIMQCNNEQSKKYVQRREG